MGLDTLENLLKRKNQRFICTAAGPHDDAGTFTAQIAHEVTQGLTADEIKELGRNIGQQEQLFKLLSVYGSVRLYCDTLSNDAAFYLAHPDEWAALGEDSKLWLDDLDEDEREELLPEWIEDAVVIGEIPSSGNYYLFPIRGQHQGKVFEFEHDGFEFIEVAKDVFGFLDYTCTVSDDLIRNIQSHTRYSDGKTDIQWLAQSYSWDQ